MKRKKFIAAIAFLAMATFMTIQPDADAYSYCVNSSWIGTNETIIIGTNEIPIQTVDYCKYGCDSKLLQCSPSDWVQYTGPLGGIGLFPMIAAFIFIIIGLMYFASKHH